MSPAEGMRSLLSKPDASLLTLVAASTLLLCGCQIAIGTPKAASSRNALPKSALEQITAQHVRDEIGGGNVVITCSHDLTISLGATEECVMAQDDKRFPLKLAITEANSPDDAAWGWERGRQLTPS